MMFAVIQVEAAPASVMILVITVGKDLVFRTSPPRGLRYPGGGAVFGLFGSLFRFSGHPRGKGGSKLS